MAITPTQKLTAAVLAWPGTSVRIGEREEYGFLRAGRELGHLHGDRVAHFGFPRELGTRLREAGRVGPHPVNRHSPKLAARALTREEDVDDVLALLRLNYERAEGEEDAEREVRALVAELDRAQDDPERFAALLTPDVAIVNIAGRRVTGRAALREAMRAALAGDLARVATRTEVLLVTFPAEDLAIVSAVKHVQDGRLEGAELPAQGAYTLTLVLRPEGWRVAALQTTPAAAVPAA